MPTDWLQFWYEALNAEIGVLIESSDFEVARRKLYDARAASGDEALHQLSILVNEDRTLMIVHAPRMESDDQAIE